MARMSKDTLQKLLWNWDVGDPIVAWVALNLGSPNVTHAEVEQARKVLRGYRERIERHGWWGVKSKAKNRRLVAELRRIDAALDEILHTYRYGQLPPYDDFRGHLRAAVDSQGKPIVGDAPVVLQFRATGRTAELAEEAISLTDRPRRIRIRRAPGGELTITIGNLKTLYNYLRALGSVRGRVAMRLGRRLAGAIGIRWI
jgi:hypothetical protein